MSPPERVTGSGQPPPRAPSRRFMRSEARPSTPVPSAPQSPITDVRARATGTSPLASGVARSLSTVRAPGAILAQRRLTHVQQVQARLAQREAGLGQDLDRILERTVALMRLELGALPRSLPQPPGIELRPGDPGSSERRSPELPTSGLPAPTLQDPGAGRIQAPLQPEQAIQEKGQALVALIDRIDRFVRDGRPALSLSLGRVGWTVQLERSGAGEVSLTVGGPGASDFPERALLDEALAARGLRLGGLRRQAHTHGTSGR